MAVREDVVSSCQIPGFIELLLAKRAIATGGWPVAIVRQREGGRMQTWTREAGPSLKFST
jgi:hypothetical protein